MDLSQLRNEIDGIDSQIVSLYEERLNLSKKVAQYKIETGKKVYDPVRENEKIEKVKSLAHSEFSSQGIAELFEQIMAVSRKLQYGMMSQSEMEEKISFTSVDFLDTLTAKVVFQGAEGAYSQAAMIEYFGDKIQAFHVDTFREAMLAIKNGTANYAVLPIENSTAGIVSDIYDLLVDFENYIVGEQIIKIEHCLLGVPGGRIEEVEAVYSHPQSLMQSSRFLECKEWKQISMKNNAFAARKVAEEGKKNQAAIASKLAGKIYGLNILKQGINNSDTNSTRFIIVTKDKVFRRDANKVSICFELPHESGSLYHLLSHFIYNHLNMTKIESRPIEGRNWEYRFFVDFEGNLEDSAVRNALQGLKQEATNMRILGNY